MKSRTFFGTEWVRIENRSRDLPLGAEVHLCSKCQILSSILTHSRFHLK